MYQIRRNVFETNSSSSHSLTLAHEALVTQPFADDVLREGVVTVAPGEFGWAWERFYAPASKLAYLVTYLTGGEVEDTAEDLTEALIARDARMAMLAQVVHEHTGCTLRVAPGYGHIDHQSLDVAERAFDTEQELAAFVFGEGSYLQTGNDNGPAPWHIPTDRGPQAFYQAMMRAVPAHYRRVTLRLRRNGELQLLTARGAALTQDYHRDLLVRLTARGVVTRATLAYGDLTFAQSDARSEAASWLTQMFEGTRLALSDTFEAVYRQVRTKESERFTGRMSLQVAVPPALAEALTALEATPPVLLRLADARKRLDAVRTWHGPLRNEDTLREAEQAVARLERTARTKGLL